MFVGIDLGSEFAKVAAIKSVTGLDIVLNEQTKRKTKTYVGFRGQERYFGEDAYNLVCSGTTMAGLEGCAKQKVMR